MFFSSLGQRTPPQESDICLVVCGSRFLHNTSHGHVEFLHLQDLGTLRSSCDTVLEIGTWEGERCFAISIPESVLAEPAVLPTGVDISETRALLNTITAPQQHAIHTARHLLWWNAHYRFCNRCGGPLEDHAQERARVCPACKNVLYPVISPAIIVAIRKDDSLLLAHNKNFPGTRHSVIAGFVEPGETLEQAVAREAREEVGVEIHNICYTDSQPWPFPNSLMLGFTADWKSGEIQVDGHEIDSAAWFHKHSELPELPPVGSIARRLIDRTFAPS